MTSRVRAALAHPAACPHPARGGLLRVFGALCLDHIASDDQTQRKVLPQPANRLHPRVLLDELFQPHPQMRVVFVQRSDGFLVGARMRVLTEQSHELAKLAQRKPFVSRRRAISARA